MPEYEGSLIVKVYPDEDISNGDSLCTFCGRIMYRCWDVVCKECRGTFCYNHIIEIGGHWYCMDCGGTMDQLAHIEEVG